MIILDAKKDEVGTKVTEVEPGLLEIEFVPQHVGEWRIIADSRLQVD